MSKYILKILICFILMLGSILFLCWANEINLYSYIIGYFVAEIISLITSKE